MWVRHRSLVIVPPEGGGILGGTHEKECDFILVTVYKSCRVLCLAVRTS